MAIYRPIQAFDLVKDLVKRPPIEDIEDRLLDIPNKIIWMAAPWRWSVAVLTSTPIVLASNTQDYTIALPSDFLYALDAYIVAVDANGEQIVKALDVENRLHTDVGTVGFPSKITIDGTPGGSGTARFYPKPGTLASGTTKCFVVYKQAAPTVTRANSSTAGLLVQPDEWSWVYESGVLWLAYKYADDPRAGEVKSDDSGRAQFSGQRADFEAAIQIMRSREKMPLFSTRAVPEPQTDRR